MRVNPRHAALAAILATVSFNAAAAILGPTDDRVEKYELPAEWQANADSTLAIARSHRIVKVHRDWKTFSSSFTLATSPDYNPPVHPEHRFAKQGPFAECSGVLINPEIMVTAAHCVSDGTSSSQIVGYSLIASGVGFTSEAQKASGLLMLPIEASRVSQFGEVLFVGKPNVAVNGNADTDYAIVKLKTPIFNVAPAAIRRGYEGAFEAPVTLMGHPFGLPFKADPKGRLAIPAKKGETFIRAFLDTASGFSGGPVFDGKSQALIGILVASGGLDWGGCNLTSGSMPTPQNYCESRRPETVAQLEGDPNVPRKLVASFRAKFPEGVITSWASYVLRIDQIADKLDELKIPYQTR